MTAIPPDLRQLTGLLRQDLTGFTVDAAERLLGPMAQRALGREQPLPAQRVVQRSSDPLATLIGTFMLGLPVSRGALARALPQLGVDGAERLKLVAAAGNSASDPVRALVDLRPYAAGDDDGTHDWWIISDPDELATGQPLPPDHVLGVGGASVTLVQATIRRRVRSVLDLGTGCGIQALHAARHATTVAGSDISVRALAMARLNWALNQPSLPGADFEALLGNMFEPVRGRRFDLVVSNPPFVITPRGLSQPGYEYRDAGLVGDSAVQQIVTSAGDVLETGGVAQILGNWEIRRGQDWTTRVAQWLDEASRLDAWVIQREVQDPAEYAETWIRDGGQQFGPQAPGLYQAWLDDFASRQVDGIGFGLIILRRPESGPPTLRRLEERRGGAPLRGNELLTELLAHDWLVRHDDQALLRTAFQVAGDVTDERHHLPGAEHPSVILLRQGGGGGRTIRASTALAGFAGACSGDLTTGQVIGALAVLLETDEAQLQTELLPQIRHLVSTGMLRPP